MAETKAPRNRAKIVTEETIPKTGVLPPPSPKSPEVVAAETGEAVITVMVIKDYTLTDDHHRPFEYKAGVTDMPQSHVDHWFSKTMGVKPYKPK